MNFSRWILTAHPRNSPLSSTCKGSNERLGGRFLIALHDHYLRKQLVPSSQSYSGGGGMTASTTTTYASVFLVLLECQLELWRHRNTIWNSKITYKPTFLCQYGWHNCSWKSIAKCHQQKPLPALVRDKGYALSIFLQARLLLNQEGQNRKFPKSKLLRIYTVNILTLWDNTG